MVDPRTGDVFVITKDYVLGESKVFRYPAVQQDDDKSFTLELVATVDFAPAGLILARATTGGDISVNGDEIVIRTYAVAWLWERAKGQSVGDALTAPPCTVTLPDETQGEAIAFTADGHDLITTSEGGNDEDMEPIYRYVRTP